MLSALAQHGIETTVDRVAKKRRIREWIQQSVIQEDEEEQEDSGTATPTSIISRTPVAGHVSSVRAEERRVKQITSTVKDAANKHIDPRTGKIQQGPSEMVVTAPPAQNQAAPLGSSNDAHRPNDLPRHHKLIDVGSQTSSESQTMIDGRIVENQSNGQRRASDSPYRTMTQPQQQLEHSVASRGLMTAFNSVATITMPEMQHTQMRQPLRSNSMKHFTHGDSINDSGYGSLDKLKTGDGNTILLSSPILSKRSIVHSTYVSVNGNGILNGGAAGRHSNQQKDSSPFNSDSGGSHHGSSGFVNLAGIPDSSKFVISMKDTPYDLVKPKRNNKYK